MSDQSLHRRSIRLKGYDYSRAGAYFVSVCVYGKKCLLGEIESGVMRLNECGKIVASEWRKSAAFRPEIECGEFVVMPNHFHGIVHIRSNHVDTTDGERAYRHTPLRTLDHEANGHTPLRSPSRNVGAMVRGFKSAACRRINEFRHTPGASVWQRNYYEHVIRNDADYNRIAEYVANNPQRWMEDSLHPLFVRI